MILHVPNALPLLASDAPGLGSDLVHFSTRTITPGTVEFSSEVRASNTGPALKNLIPNSTTPAILPRKTITDTGIGGLDGEVSLISGGVEIATALSSGFQINSKAKGASTNQAQITFDSLASDTQPVFHPNGLGTNTGVGGGQNVVSLITQGGLRLKVETTQTTITNDTIIQGNLTVQGTTTSVNSNEVNIGDNIIVLNSDETGAPSQNAGIEIERGTSANRKFQWNEASDVWEIEVSDGVFEQIASGSLDYLPLSGGSMTGQILGTATGVAYGFVGDPDTGLERSGADTLNIVSGGFYIATFNATGPAISQGSANFPYPIQAVTGNATTPSYSFDTDNDTGFYRVGANNIALSLGGTKQVDYSTTKSVFTQKVVGPSGSGVRGFCFSGDETVGFGNNGAGNLYVFAGGGQRAHFNGSGLQLDSGARVNIIDTDGTLAANSDTRLATQKAIRTYVTAAGVAYTETVARNSKNKTNASGVTTDNVVVTISDVATTSKGVEIDVILAKDHAGYAGRGTCKFWRAKGSSTWNYNFTMGGDVDNGTGTTASVATDTTSLVLTTTATTCTLTLNWATGANANSVFIGALVKVIN